MNANPDAPLTDCERARFDTLYRLHHGEVIHLLRRRLNNADDAEELAQEAYLRILRYRHCGPDSLKYLLIRTALNLAVSHGARACISRAHVSLENVEIVSDAPLPEEALADAQRWQQMVAAMQSLPDRCRQVFVLRLIHGLRQREIAEHCGISTRMVEQHLAKAQAFLRDRVQELAA